MQSLKTDGRTEDNIIRLVNVNNSSEFFFFFKRHLGSLEMTIHKTKKAEHNIRSTWLTAISNLHFSHSFHDLCCD